MSGPDNAVLRNFANALRALEVEARDKVNGGDMAGAGTLVNQATALLVVMLNRGKAFDADGKKAVMGLVESAFDACAEVVPPGQSFRLATPHGAKN